MDKPTWEKRRLGRTGMYVTPLGIGGAHLGRGPDGLDKRVAIDTVLRGLDLGMNLIDTSPMYQRGESEHSIGLALQEWYEQGGRREDLVISSKTGTRNHRERDYSYDGTMRSVEISLEMLQTDYLDILHIHDPITLEPVLEPGGALDALKALKEQGVIRAIGLGCRPHEFHQRCIETGDLDVVLTFNDYNLLYQTSDEGVLQPAAARDVGVFNATVTLNGMLTDREPREVVEARQRRWADRVAQIPPERMERFRQYRDRMLKEAADAQSLWEWCQERRVSLLALNLQYCLRDPRVASTLIGFSRPARVDEDVAACFAPIPDQIWTALHDEFGL